ncbi:hypothetical protein C8N24_1241 [Solirubrobacter pauli]|uniref:Uncharacterized protein n=1 Tax=Solirubrobacter pauli TaxID=166793 RepID=A0A660LA54_9ACTN|nr:hypothetical protein [Solirubrobacter pauli]RKQ91419.1 hypothetical protein C8N24_1241 [Solirubrobacter pauli]
MLAATLASVALLPGLLTPTVAEVKQKTTIPVLLPSTFQHKGRLFANGIGDPSMYRIQLTSTKDCQANYCSVAWFTAEAGIQLRGGKAITLAKGRKGRYWPMSCGASCAPARISWREQETGIVYGIESGKSRSRLVTLAKSAIKRGPR